MVAHQSPLSLGFSRQEHWSGLPFPSPMHENEKWKWSCSVMSDSSRPHGLQPTRLLRPWGFPGKRTGVGCHHLLTRLLDNKYRKRCSAWLIITERQIKTTIRYRVTPVRMAIIKNSTNSKCWRGCGEKATLLHCWWDINWYSHYDEQYGGSLRS